MRRLGAVMVVLQLGLAGTAFALPDAGPAATATVAAAVDPAQRSMIEEYERIEAEAKNEQGLRDDSPGFGAAFFQMVLVLFGVVALAYVLLAKVLPRMMRIEPPTAPRRLLQVVDRLPIDQRRSIFVLKMANQYFLVGAGDAGIELLSKLDALEVEQALNAADPPARPPLLDSLLKRRTPKEGPG